MYMQAYGLPLIFQLISPLGLSNKTESPVGINGKIIGQSVLFLRCCIMGVQNGAPNDYLLLQCPFQLDIFNNFQAPCQINERTLREWQGYLFQFTKSMTKLFHVYVYTKL